MKNDYYISNIYIDIDIFIYSWFTVYIDIYYTEMFYRLDI